MFTLLVWGINMCAPVHAQNKLDSLQHLNEVVVTARAVQKEIFPVQRVIGQAASSAQFAQRGRRIALLFRYTD